MSSEFENDIPVCPGCGMETSIPGGYCGPGYCLDVSKNCSSHNDEDQRGIYNE